METIKIEVSVNLSEKTQLFIKSLFGSSSFNQPIVGYESPAGSMVTTTTTKQKLAQDTKAEKTTNKPLSDAGAEQSVGIEDVRGLLAKKVNDYRNEIKAKLTELNAPSVTKLGSEHYQEMFDFLQSLG